MNTGARVNGAAAGNAAALVRRRGRGDIVLALLCVLLAGGLLPTVGNAQTDPRTLPLVSQSDVVYLGTITAPAEVGYGPAGMAVKGTRWFYGGWELTLPALGGTGTVVGRTRLPNTDQLGTNNPVVTGGVLPWGDKRIYTAYNVYDAGGSVDKSHWVALADGTVQGPFTMETPRLTSLDPGWANSGKRAGMVGGFMGIIPQEWRTLYGGPALTGQCCISIIWRTSAGPTISVFNPDHVGTLNPIPSQMAVGYPDKRATLGLYDGGPNGEVGQWYGGTDMYGGIAFPAGTRSLLFIGRRGDSMCYGPGTSNLSLHRTPHPDGGGKIWCYDPSDSDQGGHGPLYRPMITAYDAAEVLAVLQGTKQPWEIMPYAKWALPSFPVGTMTAPITNRVRGAFYDPDTKRLYVGHEDSRTVYVYEVKIGAPPPPPVPVDCVGTWGAWARVAGSETACVLGRRDYTESRTFTVQTAASGGGKACPASPETRTLAEDCAGDPPPPPPTPAIRLECTHITTITRGQDYVGGDQRWTVRGTCKELNAVGAVIGPPKE